MAEIDDYPEIELRTDEVQEILGTPPSWIVRFGTILILLILCILAIGSYYFKYPDKVIAPIELTTKVPPTNIIVETGGNITNLSVSEGDMVTKDQQIAVIEDASDYESIQKLEALLKDLKSKTIGQVVATKLPVNIGKIGGLQREYSNFRQLVSGFAFEQSENYDQQQITQVQRKIALEEKNIEREKKLLLIERKELRAKEAEVKSHQDMFADGLLSRQALENKVAERNNAIKNIKTREASISSYEAQIESMLGDMADIRNANRSEDNTQFLQIEEGLNQLIAALDLWKQTYVIRANQAGTVTFFNDIWSEGQYIKPGEALLAIVPAEQVDNPNALVGRVSLPVRGSGKVTNNQRVIIKFDNFPYQEFGVVEGQVTNKSRVPKDNIIAIEVDVPQDLISSRGEPLRFEQQMTGIAEIITEDKRLIERVFEKLIEIFGEY